MQAGFARVDITPPPGEHPEMMGFGAFLGRTALEVAQPIHVRASYLEGEEAALLLSFDVCGLAEELANGIRAAAAEAVGLTPGRVIAACTHTHSAPSLMPVIGWGEFDANTAARLPGQAAEAARAAREGAAPVRVASGVAELDQFTWNRVYKGRSPRDIRVRVLTFRAVQDGSLRGLWAHYACHPVVLCEKCRVISPDFCGVAMQALEAGRPGFVGTFLQGACGDINPLWAHLPQERSLVHLAHAGYRFRRAVETAMEETAPATADGVRAASASLALPVTLLSEDTLSAYVADSQDAAGRRALETALPRLREETARLSATPQREAPISALAVGDHTLLFHPFEMFTAVGQGIEAEVGPRTWTVGYANSHEGYAPTLDRFAPYTGDYAAHCVPLMMGRHPYAPTLAEHLAASLVALGKKVATARQQDPSPPPRTSA